MKTLALPKKTYKISLGNKDIIVMLDTEPNRTQIIEKKMVVTLDSVVINWSYIACVREVQDWDNQDGTALARAKLQHNWIRQVALARLAQYENDVWKMSQDKLQTWVNSFIHNMEAFPKFKDIYDTTIWMSVSH